MGIEPTQGRLNSAPQTVLKTAGLASVTVYQLPSEVDHQPAHSINIRHRPQASTKLAAC